MFILILVTSLVFLILALPIKNWLEIERVRKKDVEWSNWIAEKPSCKEYCYKTNQSIENIKCDYCGSSRQIPSLEMVLPFRPKFGFISNSYNKYSHFKTYICSGCGTQLYRQRYEE